MCASDLIVSAECAAETLSHCVCDTVVTCGFSPRDTLTLSAALGDAPTFSLQRDVKTLAGQTIEPCDVTAQSQTGDLGLDMAVAATCIMMNIGGKNFLL